MSIFIYFSNLYMNIISIFIYFSNLYKYNILSNDSIRYLINDLYQIIKQIKLHIIFLIPDNNKYATYQK